MSYKTQRSILNKKCPVNPKYKNVKAQVDSGATIRKYVEHMEELHRNFKLSKDEIFRRIKLEIFIRLVIEVGLNNLRADDEMATGGRSDVSPAASSLELSTDGSSDAAADSANQSRVTTARSTLHSVISGIGELDLNSDVERPVPTMDSPRNATGPVVTPYLLLDVRDQDSFNRCHIISAVNYPHTMISRAMNYETQHLLTFKNKPGFIIVVYDDDELLSQKVVITLVQRGYENIYLLSGGLKLASQKFRDGFIWKEMQQVELETSNQFTTIDLHNLQKSLDSHLESTASKTFFKYGQRTGGASGYVSKKTTKGQNGEQQNRQNGKSSSSVSLATTQRDLFSSRPRKPWK